MDWLKNTLTSLATNNAVKIFLPAGSVAGVSLLLLGQLAIALSDGVLTAAELSDLIKSAQTLVLGTGGAASAIMLGISRFLEGKKDEK